MKKILTLITLFTFLVSSFAVAQAKNDNKSLLDNLNVEALSDQFPDAYVQQEVIDLSDVSVSLIDGELAIVDANGEVSGANDKLDANQLLEFSKAGKVVAAIKAKVFVSEKYETLNENGEVVCTESKLLNEKEVAELNKKIVKREKNNIKVDVVSSALIPDDSVSDSYYNLTCTYWIGEFGTSSSPTYFLQATYDWQNVSVFGSGLKNPSSGEDFIGFVWGGGFDSKLETCSITPTTTFSYRTSTYVPNQAVTWAFNEQKDFFDYPAGIYMSSVIFKNTATGQGNTTAAVANYLHTYERHNAEVTVSVSGEGVGGSLALSSSIDYWNFALKISGLYY